MGKLFGGLWMTGLLFCSVCAAAGTVSFGQWDEYCQLQAAYAKAFAWQRQNGWSVGESLVWLRDQQAEDSAVGWEWSEAGRRLNNVNLRIAYAMPVQQSEEGKDAVIRDFEAENYIECMHTFSSLDSND